MIKSNINDKKIKDDLLNRINNLKNMVSAVENEARAVITLVEFYKHELKINNG
jgi:hypothetical protein